MFSSRVLRSVFIPSAALIAEKKLQEKEQNKPKLCRRSDLPIYVAETAPSSQPKLSEEKGLFGFSEQLESSFGIARHHVTRVYNEAQAYKKVGLDYVEQSRDNAEWLIKYLRQEDNTTPKAGAIAIGGLTGLIFGLRGGLIKRVVYTTTGALAIAAICYPKEASEYSKDTLCEARKYATIAYNFAYGVKKDDPPLQLPSLPKIPSSFSEAWDSVAKSATSLVSGDEAAKQVNLSSGGKNDIDVEAVVSKTHEESARKSCICPDESYVGQRDTKIS